MAFTAIHPDLGRIDASLLDLGAGLDWTAVYRVRPRIALRCPECGHGVHAKLSPRGLQYFAHDPGRPPECQLSSESMEHHLLKLELATSIRAAGWHAELEVRGEDGAWRADVLADCADRGTRWAWEAQLSPITTFELLTRTAKYYDAGIDVCWVTPRTGTPWIGASPCIRVAEPEGDAGWSVADGLGRFDERRGAWVVVEGTSLATFVRWVMEEKISCHGILTRYRRVLVGKGRKARRIDIWTSGRSIAAEKRHDAMRQRQQEWRQEQERKAAQAERERIAREQAAREEQERKRQLEAAEKHRLWKIEWDREQERLEAERLARQELERQAEAERREREAREDAERAERERLEQDAAHTWWAQVSEAQLRELLTAIARHAVNHTGITALPRQHQPDPAFAYGIALYLGTRLYGVVRPHPANLNRLPPGLAVFVRNAHEVEQVLARGVIEPEQVVHFDLPEHEQLQFT
ncbi:hypothetical protein KDK95_10000 [Actinospica sp. MGRD01-02]|uniref:Competence protein CoiA nuclease-like domain-containing protein n=1 Tax=Actinospica acidithermotolerans TaxID=2828514 RepID=A0A941E8S2_9ACTN|nr:competence protein CoiA family protein [Actinospica acidithermotolerans]MBR7826637.1 hypothetical protein [Actinospica acidithermotolerans]